MFKKLFAPTDMTVGTPWKSIVAFTLPMLLGNIAQQLYSTVDSIVVGTLGSELLVSPLASNSMTEQRVLLYKYNIR